MKRSTLLLAASIAALVGCATAPIEDVHFGLSKASVFDDVAPAPFSFDGPGTGQTITPLAGSGIPPMINHPVDSYLPITVKSNGCLACHDQPSAIGKPVARGQASAAPASHYAKGADGKMAVSGASYNCMACHAPQTGDRPLVGNTSR